MGIVFELERVQVSIHLLTCDLVLLQLLSVNLRQQTLIKMKVPDVNIRGRLTMDFSVIQRRKTKVRVKTISVLCKDHSGS